MDAEVPGSRALMRVVGRSMQGSRNRWVLAAEAPIVQGGGSIWVSAAEACRPTAAN
jgi:hypothetical protein